MSARERVGKDELLGLSSSGESATRIWGTGHELEGVTVRLPSGERAIVLSVRGEYDDDTTLRYLDGPHAGTLTDRDTFAVRDYERDATAPTTAKRQPDARCPGCGGPLVEEIDQQAEGIPYWVCPVCCGAWDRDDLSDFLGRVGP